jgi:hypothetical protein
MELNPKNDIYFIGSYGTYMVAQLIFAVQYTNQFRTFEIVKTGKFSQFVYTVKKIENGAN